jgi:hypothetical protein
MAKSPAWTRKEGKNPEGGLNAKGRASYNAANPGKPGLKRPQPEGGSRRDSFCARMKGMKKKLTSAKTANDPDSRINKSLRAWNCKEGGSVRGGGGNVTGRVTLPTFTVTSANALATKPAGQIIYVSNGLAGQPCIAVGNGTIWVSPAGTAISAT